MNATDRNFVRRFTGTKNAEVEGILTRALPEIAGDICRAVSRGLAGVYLGGGYGRGEGGVFVKADSHAALYNDLDFFVFTNALNLPQRKSVNAALAKVSQKWTAKLGVDVDFSPAKNVGSLAQTGNTLMFQELRNGYVCISGDPELPLRVIPELSPDRLPVSEALRLMLNRGMGLMFAGEKLAKNSTDANFILRNFNKCVLGCGDALLISRGLYRWKISERAERLAEMQSSEFSAQLGAKYADAVRFKFTPTDRLPEFPSATWEELSTLWRKTLAKILGADDIGSAAKAIRKQSRNGVSGIKNFLRWTLRMGRVDFSRSAFDDPTLKTLSMLVNELAAAKAYPQIPPTLLRAWKHFN